MTMIESSTISCPSGKRPLNNPQFRERNKTAGMKGAQAL
jgi:hypothetical protein